MSLCSARDTGGRVFRLPGFAYSPPAAGSWRMDEFEDSGDKSAHVDMGERFRTWRLFVSLIQWNVVGAVILLLALLLFRTHG